MRQNDQIMVTGNCYGGDEVTLQNQARKYGFDWPLSKCDDWVGLFFDTYPHFQPYHESVIERLRENRGAVQDVVGHVHRYEDWNAKDDYTREHVENSAINSMGQGPASYITEHIGILAQQKLREEGYWPRIKLVNTVHDSLDWEYEEGTLDPLLEALTWANERTKEWISDWFKVPLVIDFEIGPDWGHVEEFGYKAVA